MDVVNHTHYADDKQIYSNNIADDTGRDQDNDPCYDIGYQSQACQSRGAAKDPTFGLSNLFF